MNYNAFVYTTYTVVNGTRKYTSFYPLNPSLVEFIQDEAGQIFLRMTFTSGDQYTLPFRT